MKGDSPQKLFGAIRTVAEGELAFSDDVARSVEELNAAELTATNSFHSPDAVWVREAAIDGFASGIRYLFPAHSLTVITATAE